MGNDRAPPLSTVSSAVIVVLLKHHVVANKVFPLISLAYLEIPFERTLGRTKQSVIDQTLYKSGSAYSDQVSLVLRFCQSPGLH